MPEKYCRRYRMVVDGGFCAFICDLPDHEKLPVFDPTTGIHVSCPYQGGPIKEMESDPDRRAGGQIRPAHPLEVSHQERKGKKGVGNQLHVCKEGVKG